MSRIVCVVGAVCAAIVAAVVVATTSGAQGAGPPSGTLEVVWPARGQTVRVVDNPPRRDLSVGDMVIVKARLRTPDGAAMGRVQAVLLATTRGTSGDSFRAQLSATLRLPDGDLVIEGFSDETRGAETFAVVGGTGAYAGARGTVVVSDERLTFTFIP